MTDLMRYKHGKVKNKAALLTKWREHKWSNEEMRHWALWVWKDMVG